MIIYTETSGTRTVEIDITSVSNWFKPYIGLIADDLGETITTEARASFDAGSTWTAWATVVDKQELTAAFVEADPSTGVVEYHADIIEVRQTLSTTDITVSPWVDAVFIYFPDFDPVITATFPSLEMEMEFYNHVQIDASFPALLMSAALSNDYYDRSIDFEAEFPSLEMSLGGGAGLEASFPALTLSANLHPGYAGDLSATFPSLTAEMYVGSNIVAGFPSLTLSAEIIKTEPIYFSATFPSLELSVTGDNGPVIDMSCSFPALSMSMTGDTSTSSSITSSFPPLSMNMVGIVGNINDIEGTFPMLKLKISSIVTGDNDMEATFPALTLIMESGEVSGVLRYVKGLAR